MDALRSIAAAAGRYVGALADLARREPVRAFGVVRSFGALLLAFWPGLLTEPQSQALLAFAAILIGVDEAVRSQVRPANPPS